MNFSSTDYGKTVYLAREGITRMKIPRLHGRHLVYTYHGFQLLVNLAWHVYDLVYPSVSFLWIELELEPTVLALLETPKYQIYLGESESNNVFNRFGGDLGLIARNGFIKEDLSNHDCLSVLDASFTIAERWVDSVRTAEGLREEILGFSNYMSSVYRLVWLRSKSENGLAEKLIEQRRYLFSEVEIDRFSKLCQ